MPWKPFSGGDARGRCVHGSGWSPGQEREPRGQCGGARHRTCGEGGQSHRPRFRGQPPTQGRSVPQTIPQRHTSQNLLNHYHFFALLLLLCIIRFLKNYTCVVYISLHSFNRGL